MWLRGFAQIILGRWSCESARVQIVRLIKIGTSAGARFFACRSAPTLDDGACAALTEIATWYASPRIVGLHRRRRRDVLVAHEPLALAALEAGGAANPVARGAAARPFARDQRQIVAEGRALSRHDPQIVQLEVERPFERGEPFLEV